MLTTPQERTKYLKECEEKIAACVSEDVFFERYTVEHNDWSVMGFSNDGIDYGYETYGRDLGHVLAVNKEDPRRVWTIIEADGIYSEGCEKCNFAESDEESCECEHVGSMYIVSGYHLVNRLGYVITKEPCGLVDGHDNNMETYICD
mgnify:CR=1 FL=1|jgi:hypothetical protein